MYRNPSVIVRLLLITAALVLAFVATSANARRVCTFKGEVVDHGWRTMKVKSGGQCAEVNVGWRTKYIPNRRPCIGERVAVDFVLSNGYMKATKIVSLTPRPSPVRCYPPPPPPGTVCHNVAGKPKEVCRTPEPICSRTPPPHVRNKRWTPKRYRRKPIKPKKTVQREEGEESQIRKTIPSIHEPKPEPGAPPVLKNLTGEVVASTPKRLSIRVIEEGSTEVVPVKVGLKTKFIPFRRPAVGEKVDVEYQVENGDKFGITVKVVQ
jgi:hypothetical protein